MFENITQFIKDGSKHGIALGIDFDYCTEKKTLAAEWILNLPLKVPAIADLKHTIF